MSTNECLGKQIEGYHIDYTERMMQSGMFLFSYSIVRPLIHPIVSGTLSQARSWFFEVKIARSVRDVGCSQTNTDKITYKGGCHFLLIGQDYTLLCHSQWFYTRQRPNQKR